MARQRDKSPPSAQTSEEAARIARGSQQPGQSKEETKRIVQGIEKGIALYKKQQKAKARELDKRLKRARSKPDAPKEEPLSDPAPTAGSPFLPWMLLALSWGFFGAYLLLS